MDCFFVGCGDRFREGFRAAHAPGEDGTCHGFVGWKLTQLGCYIGGLLLLGCHSTVSLWVQLVRLRVGQREGVESDQREGLFVGQGRRGGLVENPLEPVADQRLQHCLWSL